MKMIILRGLPGASKTTFVKNEFAPEMERLNKRWAHISAGHYFEDKGEYKFDHTKLGKAHGEAFLAAVEAQTALPQVDYIIIDNTSSTKWEISPYIALANAYLDEHLVLEFPCDVETSISRNIHGVPRAAIENMAKRWENPLKQWNHCLFDKETWKEKVL